MEFVRKCISCNDKPIDQVLNFKTCAHQPLCIDCVRLEFVIKGNTVCPYCSKSVGNTITFGDGIITIREDESTCIVCHRSNQHLMTWQLCPCGCECRFCANCIVDYGNDRFETFCYCTKSRSQTPYEPPASFIKNLQNKANLKEFENQNDINLRNGNINGMHLKRNVIDLDVLEDAGSLQGLEDVVEDSDELEILEDSDELEILEDSDELEILEDQDELEILEEISKVIHEDRNDENTNNLEIANNNSRKIENENVINLEDLDNPSDLGDLKDVNKYVDLANINYRNIINLDLKKNASKSESVAKTEILSSESLSPELSISNKYSLNYTKFPNSQRNKNQNGDSYQHTESKEQESSTNSNNRLSERKSKSYDNSKQKLNDFLHDEGRIKKRIICSRESSIVFDDIGDTESCSDEETISERINDKSRLQSLLSGEPSAFKDENVQIDRTKIRYFYNLSKSSPFLNFDLPEHSGEIKLKTKEMEEHVIDGDSDGSSFIVLSQNRKKRKLSPGSKYSKRRRLSKRRFSIN